MLRSGYAVRGELNEGEGEGEGEGEASRRGIEGWLSTCNRHIFGCSPTNYVNCQQTTLVGLANQNFAAAHSILLIGLRRTSGLVAKQHETNRTTSRYQLTQVSF